MLKYNIINSYYGYIKKDITKKEFKQHIKYYRQQMGGAADKEIEKNITKFISYVQNLNLSYSSSQIKKSIDDLIKKLTNEIEQLKKQNQDNQNSLKEGQSKTGELQKKYNDTNTIKEQLENDLNTLNNFLKEKNKKYDDLQKTYDNLIDEKTRVEEQLKEQIKEQTKISEIILDDSKKTSEKLNLERIKNMNNESEIRRLTGEIERLTGEIERINREKLEVEQTLQQEKERVEQQLMGQLQTLQQEKLEVERQLATLRQEKERVEQELREQLQTSQQQFQSLQENSTREIEELRSEIDRINASMNQTIIEKENIKRERLKLVTDKESIIEQIKKLRVEYNEYIEQTNKTINSQNDKIKNLEFVRNLKDKIISEHEEKINKYKELSSSLLEDSLKNLGEVQKISKRSEIYTKYGLQGGWEAVFKNIDAITIYELPEVIFEARYNQFTSSLSAIAKEEIIDVTQLIAIYSKFLKQYEEDYNIIIDFINTFSKVKIERIKLDLPDISSIKEYKIKKSEAINLLNILKSNQNILISIIKNIQKMLPK